MKELRRLLKLSMNSQIDHEYRQREQKKSSGKHAGSGFSDNFLNCLCFSFGSAEGHTGQNIRFIGER